MRDSVISVSKGGLAGVAAGVLGTLAMYGVQRLIAAGKNHRMKTPEAELMQRGGRQDIATLKRAARRSRKRQDDATVLAATATAGFLGRGRLSETDKHYAGLIAHYAFGAAAGAAYGVAVKRFPQLRAQGGVLFGLGVWLIAAEATLPLLGLTRAPQAYPPRDHFTAAASHIVFGVTTETVRRRLCG